MTNANLCMILTVRDTHFSCNGAMPRVRKLSSSKSFKGPEAIENESVQGCRGSGFAAKAFASEAYDSIKQSPCTTVVEINTLSLADVSNLLNQMLPKAVIKDNVVDYVFNLCAGSPFWCKAIAGYILESGYDAFVKSISSVDCHDQHAIGNLVLSRFERLNSVQQVIAKHASVIGDEFTIAEIASVLPSAVRSLKLDFIVTSLIDAGFLYMIDEVEKSFTFQNEIIRDTLYDIIPPRYVQLQYYHYFIFIF